MQIEHTPIKAFKEPYSHNMNLSDDFKSEVNQIHHTLNMTKQEKIRQFQELVEKYITCEQTKKMKGYTRVWLYLAGKVKDKEEVFTFMYRNDIGITDEELYEDWINLYIERRQFILANQLFQLAERNLSRMNILSKQKLLEAISYRLTEDFYKQPFFEFHVDNESDKDLVDSLGISGEDFDEIKNIDIEKRISSFVDGTYSITNSGRSKLVRSSKKKRSGNLFSMVSDRRGKKRKKYSDLINRRNYNGFQVYVARDCRDIIEETTKRAYEYAYLCKYYNIPQREVKYNENGNEFWIRTKRQQELDNIIFKRKKFSFKRHSILNKKGSGHKRILKLSSKKKSDRKRFPIKKNRVSNVINDIRLSDIRKSIDFQDFDLKNDLSTELRPNDENLGHDIDDLFDFKFGSNKFFSSGFNRSKHVYQKKIFKNAFKNFDNNISKEMPRKNFFF